MQDVKILIVAENSQDSNTVRERINDLHAYVSISSDEKQAVEDFDVLKPDILILAFTKLEQAERYYLILNKNSQIIHTHVYKTILLCCAKDIQKVYEYCKDKVFDDYVLYWPVGYDFPRLNMAIAHAEDALNRVHSEQPSSKAFADQVRRLSGLKQKLHELQESSQGLSGIKQQVTQTERDILNEIDHISKNLIEDNDGLHSIGQQLKLLKQQQVNTSFKQIAAFTEPLELWNKKVSHGLTTDCKSLDALQVMAEKVLPIAILVDDDAFQHKLLKAILKPFNIELQSFICAAEAFDSIKKNVPDLIFMDVKMPDMNGLEALKIIKSHERFSQIPVVMVTGDSERETVAQCVENGASDYIVKPLDKDVIASKLKILLGM